LREVKLQIEALRRSNTESERNKGENLKSACESLEHQVKCTPGGEGGTGITSWMGSSLERMIKGLKLL